ncbi:MAG: hypothetical protein HC930_17375 [Hydrococcus sp. SU_1_0]|nr:hypothetical protein [Hydrococcus sp. SU_1_0]
MNDLPARATQLAPESLELSGGQPQCNQYDISRGQWSTCGQACNISGKRNGLQIYAINPSSKRNRCRCQRMNVSLGDCL